MAEFRFAIMGAGNIASKFCDAVELLADCRVVAVASKSRERADKFAEKNHIDGAYDSYEEMLTAEKPDCVYIAVMPVDHFQLTMLCLKHKVPVLCEKAMFVNGEEAKEAFATAKTERIFAMEAMWSRFLPAILKAKEWLEEGRIGEPELLDVSIGFVAPQEDSNLYYNRALGGGAARHITVYAYEIADFLLNQQKKEVNVQVIWGNTGVDLSEHISIRYERTLATLTTSFVASMEERLEICGKKGRIVVPYPHFAGECFLYGTDGEILEHFKDEVTQNGFVYEIQEVMDCIKSGRIESAVVPHALTRSCAELFDRIDATK